MSTEKNKIWCLGVRKNINQHLTTIISFTWLSHSEKNPAGYIATHGIAWEKISISTRSPTIFILVLFSTTWLKDAAIEWCMDVHLFSQASSGTRANRSTVKYLNHSDTRCYVNQICFEYVWSVFFKYVWWINKYCYA